MTFTAQLREHAEKFENEDTLSMHNTFDYLTTAARMLEDAQMRESTDQRYASGALYKELLASREEVAALKRAHADTAECLKNERSQRDATLNDFRRLSKELATAQTSLASEAEYSGQVHAEWRNTVEQNKKLTQRLSDLCGAIKQDLKNVGQF